VSDPLQGELIPLEQSASRLREASRHAERLLQALSVRDAAAIRVLLAHDAARSLPREVREEALLFLQLPARTMRAPMLTILHARRIRELMGELSRDALKRAG
jgi:hypothetical protein